MWLCRPFLWKNEIYVSYWIFPADITPPNVVHALSKLDTSKDEVNFT